MNKVISGILAISLYLGLIFLILLYYNMHNIKVKNYVEKNSNRVTVTLVNSNKTVFNKSSKHSTPTKPLRVHHSIRPQKSHIVPPKSKILYHFSKSKKVHTPRKKEVKVKKIAREKKRRASTKAKAIKRAK
ncbi:MAG: hypothetical protein KAU90_08665, partial [Sulfurovaceae bacterium]|nr:hypothetical protein [Sulfurovaceae bacterium]